MKKLITLSCLLFVLLTPIDSFADTNEYITCSDLISFQSSADIDLYQEPYGTIYSELVLDDYEYGYEELFSLENDDIRIRCEYLYVNGENHKKITSKKQALKMFNENKEFLNEAFNNDHEVTVVDEEPFYIKSDKKSGDWLRIKCFWEVDGDTYIYLNAISDTVYRIIIVDGGDSAISNRVLTKADFSIVDEIVKTYKDTGYAKQQLESYHEGDYEDFDEDDGFDSVETMFSIGIAFLGVISSALGIKSKKSGKKSDKNKGVKINIGGREVELETPFDDEETNRDVDIINSEDEQSINDDEEESIVEIESEDLEYSSNEDIEVQYIEKKSSNTRSYEDGLRALYKSGIMTRQELNEMLNKYYGNNR